MSQTTTTGKLKVSTVTIRETDRGWLNKHNGRYYATAIGALNAIKRGNSIIARSFGGSATVITWEPTTHIGTRIVKAITPSPL